MRQSLVQLCVFTLTLVHCSEFGGLFTNWSTTCRENHCPRSGDGSDYLTNVVPWTLTSDTIHQFDSGNGSPHCRTVHELVETITHPVANYTCQVPWMSNGEICSILDQYSIIFWSGDSLMRHMTQALHILLKQDLQYGGYPTPRLNDQTIPHKYCSCDGQFSESAMCRNYKQEFNFTDMTAQLGVCPQLRGKFPKTEFVAQVEASRHFVPDHNMFVRPPAQGCVNDTRPMFFFIEGGAHFGTNAPLYIDNYLRPTLEHIQYYARACHTESVADGHPLPYRVHIAASGLAFSSDAVVANNHRQQSQEHTALFYLQLDTFFKKEFPHVALLNLVALTREGTLAGRGDGFHSLTDINLIKVQIALNAMKLFLKSDHHDDHHHHD